NNQTLKEKRFIVQGFGNVGYWASYFLEQEGAKLVAIQDAFGSLHNPEGIPVAGLLDYSIAHKGNIVGFPEASNLAKDDFFSVDCDICIPAALGNQITNDNAHLIKAKVIAEGANGPIDIDGEKILSENGVGIIPDILCNSGGVIASYFEWLQNRTGEMWLLAEVMDKLEKKLKNSFNGV